MFMKFVSGTEANLCIITMECFTYLINASNVNTVFQQN